MIQWRQWKEKEWKKQPYKLLIFFVVLFFFSDIRSLVKCSLLIIIIASFALCLVSLPVWLFAWYLSNCEGVRASHTWQPSQNQIFSTWLSFFDQCMHCALKTLLALQLPANQQLNCLNSNDMQPFLHVFFFQCRKNSHAKWCAPVKNDTRNKPRWWVQLKHFRPN